MKEHINRKHAGAKIPDNLLSFNKNFDFNKQSLQRPQSFTFLPSWSNYANYIGIPPSQLPHDYNSREEKRNNSFFQTILEYVTNMNLINNHTLLPYRHFYQNNNVFNVNSYQHYEPLSNIDFGQPLLFKIYKCTGCFRDTLFIFPLFDFIKTSSEHRCTFNCDFLPNQQNKNIIDPEIKTLAIKKILSIIDKKVEPKLCLKCIKIPTDFYEQLNSEQQQSNNNEKYNENYYGKSPWLQKMLLNEDFIDLANTDVNNWAYGLTISNDNRTEITREELLHFINLGNSTFGLFKFQKDHSITQYFFTYLQLEKKENFEHTNYAMIQDR